MNFDLSTSTSPWYQAPITPSNTVDFDAPTQGIYVGVAGDVSVVRHDGTAVLFTGVPAGSVLPVVARRVGVSGTSASGLVGLWGVELGPVWSGSFSPLDLSPVLWLDASDTSTITESGGAVSQWDDKSGNGNNVVQATAAAQPTSGTRTINSLNVLDFGGNDYLTGGDILDLGTLGRILLVVGVTDLTTGGPGCISIGVTSNAAGRWIFGRSGADDKMLAFVEEVSGSSVEARAPTAFTSTDPNLHVMRYQRDTTDGLELRINGTELADATTSGTTNYNIAASLLVGAVTTTVNVLNGTIAEIIVVDGTLTADQITDTEQYLADKWGITLP